MRNSAISPRVKTVEHIAHGLGIPVWLLFIPDIQDDLKFWRQMDRLVTAYKGLPAEGREMVQRAIELESRYTHP